MRTLELNKIEKNKFRLLIRIWIVTNFSCIYVVGCDLAHKKRLSENRQKHH